MSERVRRAVIETRGEWPCKYGETNHLYCGPYNIYWAHDLGPEILQGCEYIGTKEDYNEATQKMESEGYEFFLGRLFRHPCGTFHREWPTAKPNNRGHDDEQIS